MKVFDFPGRGVGAFVLIAEHEGVEKIAWVGLFLTGLDGRALNLEAVPSENGGFQLLQKRADPVNYGEQWPNGDQVKVVCGGGDIVAGQEGDTETLELDLRVDRVAAGGPEVTTSPPPPAQVGIRMKGVRIA